MDNIAEIEAAIEKLPDPQVNELAHWLENLLQKRTKPAPAEVWLKHARGAAIPRTSTEEIVALTRGEE